MNHSVVKKRECWTDARSLMETTLMNETTRPSWVKASNYVAERYDISLFHIVWLDKLMLLSKFRLKSENVSNANETSFCYIQIVCKKKKISEVSQRCGLIRIFLETREDEGSPDNQMMKSYLFHELTTICWIALIWNTKTVCKSKTKNIVRNQKNPGYTCTTRNRELQRSPPQKLVARNHIRRH